LRFNKINIEFN
jgi:myosin-5